MFFWTVYAYNFVAMWIPWCVDTCLTEGWLWYTKTNEITTLCSKQVPRHIWSVFSCSKKHFISCLLHANICLLTVEQIHTSMKRLRTAYNNAYRIMHYIPRNESIHPHQVSHCVTTFDALLRNNIYRFLQCCASSTNFFMLFTNLRFSLFNADDDSDQLIWFLMHWTSVRVSSIMFLYNNEKLTYAALKIRIINWLLQNFISLLISW